jgi:multiple sugar transport system permease protein/raffinose/stachyose/melibiose transport system permease protein/N-acetylglucosamine transport system permease protein
MLILASMIAFAVTRYHLAFGRVVLTYILVGQTISLGMIIFPVVILLREMHLASGHAGLILTYIAGGLPFAVFVMQGFFAGIPHELYESAEIDGANEWILFSKIALPLAKPSIAAVMLFQFMWVWNEFVLAFTVIRDKANRTIIVGLYSVVNGVLATDYVTAFAGTVIVCLPIIAIYLLFQRYLIQGLMTGAVKG